MKYQLSLIIPSKALADQADKALEKILGKEVMLNAFTPYQPPKPPKSRAERFQAARDDLNGAKEEAAMLGEELQQWYDNLPENFQSGEKGSQLEEAISQLEEFVNACDEADGIEVEFPGMFG